MGPFEIREAPLAGVTGIERKPVEDSRGMFERLFCANELKGILDGTQVVQVNNVAIDIRRGSPTFLRWYGERLSEDNHLTLVIPEGFAHGFQAFQYDSEIVYCCKAPWTADSESGLHPSDPMIGVQWPSDITQLSDRDGARPYIDASFTGVVP